MQISLIGIISSGCRTWPGRGETTQSCLYASRRIPMLPFCLSVSDEKTDKLVKTDEGGYREEKKLLNGINRI